MDIKEAIEVGFSRSDLAINVTSQTFHVWPDQYEANG